MFIIKRTDIIKMSFLHKAVYRLNASPLKNAMTLSTEVEQKKILKFVGTHKKLSIAKTILRKKCNTGDITLLDFKL